MTQVGNEKWKNDKSDNYQKATELLKIAIELLKALLRIKMLTML